jgi:multisubunit Na+/H+ antiporter MnhF subunit
MNAWLVASAGALVLLAPAGALAMRGDVLERIVGMQLSSTITTLALVLLAEGLNRDVYFDLAVVAGFCAMAGTLFFLRILETRL